MQFIPREEQREVLNYTGGTMGVSAVPGAGKTHTLSALAADLIEKTVGQQPLDSYEDPVNEILVVTFSNAAQMVFSTRIAGILQSRGITPGYGYKVSTIHALAADILYGHSAEIGIPEDFVVIDDIEAQEFVRQATSLWMKEDDGKILSLILNPNIPEETIEEFRKKEWLENMTDIASKVIAKAKDYRLQPEDLRSRLSQIKDEFGYGLLEAICSIYEYYQTLLRSYPAMDFADLMLNSCRLLNANSEYLSVLQSRYSYILEDEAQDSTQIQEEFLKLLTAKHNNWVRVGDPNQSINFSFTTSSPECFTNFLKKAEKKVDMNVAGRSQLSVICQANFLIDYISKKHSNEACRSALTEPYICPTKHGDLQGNPENRPDRIQYDIRKYYSKEDEMENICRLAVEHVKNNPSETTVILVPTNRIGHEFVSRLSSYQVDVIEVLKNTSKARKAALVLAEALAWLSFPQKNEPLKNLFSTIYSEKNDGEYYLTQEDITIANSVFDEITNKEDFFYPLSDEEFEKMITGLNLNEMLVMTLFRFRYFLKRWIEARFLPIDQLVLLIAQDLFDDPDNLCCAGQIGFHLLLYSRSNPLYNLNDFAKEAKRIAEGNHKKLAAGLHGTELEYDPNRYPGKIAVTTYHSAKGLEWDQVFATKVSNYYFPDIKDREWRLEVKNSPFKDKLDLKNEMFYALECIAFPEKRLEYVRGVGTKEKWKDYVSERMRLLYVGITRAKKGLYISGSNPPEMVAELIKYWNNKTSGVSNAKN